MILRSVDLKGTLQRAVEVSDHDESDFKLKVAESGNRMVSIVDSGDNFFEVLSDQTMYYEEEEQMVPVPVVTEPKTGPKNDTKSEAKGEAKSKANAESTTTNSFCWWFKTMLFLVAIIMLMVPIFWMAFAGVKEVQTITTTANDSNGVRTRTDGYCACVCLDRYLLPPLSTLADSIRYRGHTRTHRATL